MNGRTLDARAVWVGMLLSLLLTAGNRAAAAPAEGVLRRWAVLATPALREAGAADLVTVRLAAAGVQIVERDDLPALAEELVRAETIGAASATRLKLGKLLGADALLLLSLRPAQQDQPAALVMAISETRWGARLCSEQLPWEPAQAEATLQQVGELALQTRQRFTGGVRRIVGLSPFMCQDLLPRYNHLAAPFTRLLEAELLSSPGVAVLEIEEARALSRELTLTGGDALNQRPVPCFVEAEYRTQEAAGAAGPVRVRFKGRVLTAGGAARDISAHTTTLEEAADYLRRTLAPAVLDAPASQVPALSADEQFRALTRRADAFFRLGLLRQALDLREAALLLEPDNLPHRRTLLEDYLASLADEPLIPGRLRRAPTLEREQAWPRALLHLEALIRRRGLSRVAAGRLAQTVLSAAPSHVPAAHAELNQARRSFLRHLTPIALALPLEAPGPRAEPAETETAKWCTAYLETAQKPLGASGPQLEDYELVRDLLERHLAADKLPPAEAIDFLVPGRLAAADDPAAAALIKQLRQALEASPRPLNQWLVRVADHHVRVEYHAAHPQEPVPKELLTADRRLERELTEQRGGAGGQAQSDLLNAALWKSVPLHKSRVALERRIEREARAATGAAPLDALPTPEALRELIRRRDAEKPPVVHFRVQLQPLTLRVVREEWEPSLGAPAGIVPLGPGVELWWSWSGAWLMRQPGLLEPLPDRHRPGRNAAPDADRLRDVAWDGRRLYLATGRGIDVRDADGRRVGVVAAAQGLPPCDLGLKLHALGDGKLIAVGGFGTPRRSWCALIAPAGADWSVRVFHEGKHSSDRVGPGARDTGDAERAFLPARLHPLRIAGRTFIMCETDDRRNPPLIDVERLAVSVAPFALPRLAVDDTFYDWALRTCRRSRLTGPPWRLEPLPELPMPPAASRQGEEAALRVGRHVYLTPSWRRLDLETQTWEALGDPERREAQYAPAEVASLRMGWLGMSSHHGLVGVPGPSSDYMLPERLYRIEVANAPDQVAAAPAGAAAEQRPAGPEPVRLAPAARRGVVIPPQPRPMPAAWSIDPPPGQETPAQLACSPDGKWIATVQSTGAVAIWDAATGGVVRQLVLPKPTVQPSIWQRQRRLVWSPDNQRLAVVHGINSVELLDVRAGRRLEPLRTAAAQHGPVVAWSPDGSRLAVGGQGTLEVWDIARRACIGRWPQVDHNGVAPPVKGGAHLGVVHQLAFAPDGRRLLSAIDHIVATWDIGADGAPRPVDNGSPFPPERNVRDYVGGSYLWWTDAGEAGILQANGQVLVDGKPMIPAPKLEAVAVSALLAVRGDGRRLLTAPGQAPPGVKEPAPPRLWRLDQPEAPTAPVRALHGVVAMDWLPGSEQVVAICNNQLMWFHTETGAIDRAVAFVASPFRAVMGWSPDGRYLACGVDSTRVYDAATGQPVRSVPGSFRAWSPDGRQLAVSRPGGLRLVDADTGASRGELEGEDGPVAWSPDQQLIAYGSHLVDARTLARRWSGQHPSGGRTWTPLAASWSARGDLLALGGPNRVVRIYEPQRGEMLAEFHVPSQPRFLRLMWFGSGGQLLAENGLWDWTSRSMVREWYPKSPRLLAVLPPAEGRPAVCLRLAPQRADRKDAATVQAEVWDAALERVVHTWRVQMPIGQYAAYALAPDGRRVAVAPVNGPVQVWDLRRGKLLARIFSLPNDQWAVASDTGLVGSADGMAQLAVAIEDEHGPQLLTCEEFSRIYGWKNDVESVTLSVPD